MGQQIEETAMCSYTEVLVLIDTEVNQCSWSTMVALLVIRILANGGVECLTEFKFPVTNAFKHKLSNF